MKTISNREFAAHPEMYLDMARDGEVRITKGRQVFYLTCEPEYNENQREPTDDEVWRMFAARYPDGMPAMLSDEEEIANSLSFDELMVGIHEDIDRKWAQRRK
jgi:hypothetical protein